MIGRFLRAGGSIGALVVLIVGAPALLLAASDARFESPNPFARIRPPWRWGSDDVAEAVRRPLEDDTVADLIIRTSLVVAWIAIAAIVATTVLEVVHLLRHRHLPPPRRPGLGWAQPFARFIAIGIVGLLPSVASASGQTVPISPLSAGPVASTATQGEEPIVTTVLDDVLRDEPTESLTVDAGERVHVVERGESVWSIAASLSDGSDADTMRIAESILDRNLGAEMSDGSTFSSAALIRPGWTLVVPDVAPSPVTDVTAGRERTPTIPTEISSERAETVVVEPGDTLSGLADEHLDDAGAWTEIAEVNLGRTMGDGRVFEDPDVIVPGWELELPGADVAESASAGTVDEPVVPSSERSAGTDPGSPSIDPAEPAVPSSERSIGAESSAHDDGDVVDGIADWFDDRDDPNETAAPVTESTLPTAMTTTTTMTTTVPPVADAAPGDEIEIDDAAPSAPAPLGIEHAAMLAGGILTIAGVRRRRRLRAAAPRARLPEPPETVVETTRVLGSLGGAERAARFDVARRALAHRLLGSGAQPGIVLHAADGTIEVALRGAATPAAPWTGDEHSWELPASTPIELLADDARQVGETSPALVAVGAAGDTEVHVDLEAAGRLAINAPASRADQVVNAIAATLSSSTTAETAHIVTVGLGATATFDHPNVHRATDLDAALRVAHDTVGSTLRHEQGTFELRARRTGGEAWEPAILLCSAATDIPSTIDLPRAGHGLAIVARAATRPGAAVPAEGVCLTASDDGWRLDGFGWQLPVIPFGLDDEALRRLHDVLDDADTEPSLDEEVVADPITLDAGDEVVDHLDMPGTDDTRDEVVAAAADGHVHEILVRTLGGVSIERRDGATHTWQRSKTVELIAWLATHRLRSTRSAARTAMWAQDVRDATFSNVVSEARRGLATLAPPPEDEEWIARTLSEELPLHDAVVTDLDLIRDRLDAARLAAPTEAVGMLRPVLDHVRGLPFAGTSYLWPDADGLVTEATLLATTLCTELAEHGLSLGDTEVVFEATSHGLAVLPGHEDLIAVRMRAHAAAGDLAAVRREWESYERVLNADAWSDGEPAPKLVELRHELLSR